MRKPTGMLPEKLEDNRRRKGALDYWLCRALLLAYSNSYPLVRWLFGKHVEARERFLSKMRLYLARKVQSPLYRERYPVDGPDGWSQ